MWRELIQPTVRSLAASLDLLAAIIPYVPTYCAVRGYSQSHWRLNMQPHQLTIWASILRTRVTCWGLSHVNHTKEDTSIAYNIISILNLLSPSRNTRSSSMNRQFHTHIQARSHAKALIRLNVYSCLAPQEVMF